MTGDYLVCTAEGLQEITADKWEVSGNGLIFFKGDNKIAWFLNWHWFREKS